MSDNIKVAIRVRPLIQKEAGIHQAWVVKDNAIAPLEGNGKPGIPYVFDRIFDEHNVTYDIFEEICKPICDEAVKGFHGTVFAYGQSSSGKTFTMTGTAVQPGVITLAIEEIFSQMDASPDREFLMRVSYLEIYNEKVSDLLSDEDKVLKIQVDTENNVQVSGAIEEVVKSISEINDVIKKGNARRHTAETKQNDRSSRSHCILRMIIESREKGDEDSAVLVSHLNFVDLAGSEKATENTGERFREGCAINRSLLTLGQVIHKLSGDDRLLSNTHVSFRDSKLTRILQNALGGNSKTAMICTITPASLEESHSTLKFASSAKSIKNKPQINETLSDTALLKKYRLEIQRLQKLVSEKGTTDILLEKEDLQKKLQERKEADDKQAALIKKLKEMLVVCEPKRDEPGPPAAKKRRRETWCPGRMIGTAPPLKPERTSFKDFISPAKEVAEESMNNTFGDKSVFGEKSLLGRKSVLDEKREHVTFRLPMIQDISFQEADVSFSMNTVPVKELHDLQDKYEALLEQNEKLQTELNELQEFTSVEREFNNEQWEKSKERVEELDKEVITLKRAEKTMKERLEAYELNMPYIEENLLRVERERNVLRAEVVKLKEKVHEHEGTEEATNGTETAKSLEDEAVERAENQKLDKEEKRSMELEARNEELEVEKRRSEDLAKDKLVLEELKEEKDEMIRKLEIQMAEIQSQFAEIQEEREILRGQVVTLQTKLHDGRKSCLRPQNTPCKTSKKVKFSDFGEGMNESTFIECDESIFINRDVSVASPRNSFQGGDLRLELLTAEFERKEKEYEEQIQCWKQQYEEVKSQLEKYLDGKDISPSNSDRLRTSEDLEDTDQNSKDELELQKKYYEEQVFSLQQQIKELSDTENEDKKTVNEKEISELKQKYEEEIDVLKQELKERLLKDQDEAQIERITAEFELQKKGLETQVKELQLKLDERTRIQFRVSSKEVVDAESGQEMNNSLCEMVVENEAQYKDVRSRMKSEEVEIQTELGNEEMDAFEHLKTVHQEIQDQPKQMREAVEKLYLEIRELHSSNKQLRRDKTDLLNQVLRLQQADDENVCEDDDRLAVDGHVAVFKKLKEDHEVEVQQYRENMRLLMREIQTLKSQERENDEINTQHETVESVMKTEELKMLDQDMALDDQLQKAGEDHKPLTMTKDDQVKMLEEKVKNLESELQAVRSSGLTLSESVMEEKTEIRENCKSKLDQVSTSEQTELSDDKRTLTEQEEMLTVYEEKLKSLTEEVEQLKSQLTLSEESEVTRMNEREKLIAEHEEIVKGYEESIKLLTEEVETYKSELDKISALEQTELSDEKKRLIEQGDMLTIYEERLSSLNDEVEQLKSQLLLNEENEINTRNNREKLIEEHEEIVKSYEESIKLLTEEVESYKSELDRISSAEENKLSEEKHKPIHDEDTLNIYEGKLNLLGKEVEDLKSQLLLSEEAELTRRNEKEKMIEEHKEVVKGYEENIKILTEKVESYKSELDKMSNLEQKELTDGTKLEVQQGETLNIHEARKEVEELKSKLVLSEENGSVRRNQEEKIIAEHEEIVKGYEESIKILTEEVESYKTQLEKISNLEEMELSDEKRKLIEQADMLNMYEERLNSLNDEVEQLKSQLQLSEESETTRRNEREKLIEDYEESVKGYEESIKLLTEEVENNKCEMEKMIPVVQHEETVKVLEEEVANLQERIKTIESDSEQKLKDTNLKLEVYEESVKEFQDEVRRLENSNDEINTNCNMLQTELSESNLRVEELTNKIQALESKLKESVSNHDHEQEVMSLKGDYEKRFKDAVDECIELKEEIIALRSKLESSSNTHEQEVMSLKDVCKEKLQVSEEKYSQLENELIELRKSLQNGSESQVELQIKLEEAEKKLQTVTKDYEEKLKTVQSEKDKLKTERDDIQSERDNLEDTLYLKQHEFTVSCQLDTTRPETTQLEKQWDDYVLEEKMKRIPLLSKVKSLTTELQKEKQKVTDLEKKVQEGTTIVVQKSDEETVAKTKYDELHKLWEKAEEDADSLNMQLVYEKDHMARLEKKLEEMQQKASKLEVYEETVKDFQEEVRRLENINDELNTKYSTVQTELSQRNDRMQELTKQVQTLENQMRDSASNMSNSSYEQKMTSQKIELEKKFEQSVDECMKLKKEVLVLKNKLEISSSAYEQEVMSLKEACKEKLIASEEKCSQMERELIELRSQHRGVINSVELTAKQGQAEEKLQMLEEYEKKLKKLQSDVDELKIERDDLQSERDELKDTLYLKENEFSVSCELDTTRPEATDLEKKWNEYCRQEKIKRITLLSKLKSLTKELQEKTAKVAELQKTVQEKTTIVVQKPNENTVPKTKYDELYKLYQKAEDDADALNQDLIDEKMNTTALEKRLEEAQKKLVETESKVKEAAKVAPAAENKDLWRENGQLKLDNFGLKRDYQKLEDKYEEMKKQYEETFEMQEERVSKLKNQLRRQQNADETFVGQSQPSRDSSRQETPMKAETEGPLPGSSIRGGIVDHFTNVVLQAEKKRLEKEVASLRSKQNARPDMTEEAKKKMEELEKENVDLKAQISKDRAEKKEGCPRCKDLSLSHSRAPLSGLVAAGSSGSTRTHLDPNVRIPDLGKNRPKKPDPFNEEMNKEVDKCNQQ